MDNNLRIEKTLEALEEVIIQAVGEKNVGRCPALRILRRTISNIEAANNMSIASEVGITIESGERCPHLKKG